MKRWVTQYVQAEGTDAVAKAKEDVADIAETMGYAKLPVFIYDDSGEADDGLIARIDGITAAVMPGDILLYQYPSKWFGYRFDSAFINRLTSRGVDIILFIHDIDSFTGGTGVSVEEEVQVFNTSTVLITHGERMSEWLASQGVTKSMVNKEIFDFLLKENAPLSQELNKRVSFAGWLPKSPFLCDWQQSVPIDAYGAKDNLILSEKVNYHGEFSQEALIREIAKDTFGLSWAQNVGGIVHHDYQRYNNPLKVSLYLSLGLPVIAWSEAATASFIEKYGVGFTVSELDEIEEKINDLTSQDLLNMKARVNNFSCLTRNGYFTRKSLLEAENIVLLNRL